MGIYQEVHHIKRKFMKIFLRFLEMFHTLIIWKISCEVNRNMSIVTISFFGAK